MFIRKTGDVAEWSTDPAGREHLRKDPFFVREKRTDGAKPKKRSR